MSSRVSSAGFRTVSGSSGSARNAEPAASRAQPETGSAASETPGPRRVRNEDAAVSYGPGGEI